MSNSIFNTNEIKIKEVSPGNIEVESNFLKGTPFEYFAVRCSDPIMKNMTDEEIKEDLENFDGDGIEMKFNIFINHNTCLRFNFNLFGLDESLTISRVTTDNDMECINLVNNRIREYFFSNNRKWITDITETFYKKFETEILQYILEGLINESN